MASLENVFIQEFKRKVRSGTIKKSIFDMSLPESSKNWQVSGTELYVVRGIPSVEKYYSQLNGKVVKKLYKNFVAKRRKIDLVSRSFVIDNEGKFVYEDVKVPSGSIVIISEANLSLPFKYKSPESGFGYIDFVQTSGVREFIYYVPKKYLYPTNQTALVLSVKNMKDYAGKGYLTWNYGTVFLHVIPYRPNANYIGTKILKTGLTLNYSSEIQEIVDNWQNKGIIPCIELCNTDLEGNLVLKDTIRGYDDYQPIEELSLGDREIYGSDDGGS